MRESSVQPSVVVSLTLHGDVRRFRPKDAPDRAPITVPGNTVADLLALLPLRPGEQVVVAVNGEVVTPQTVLHEGDEVLLSTPMEGG